MQRGRRRRRRSARANYHGSDRFVSDVNSPDFRHDSFEDFEEGGRVVWVERVKPKFGSDS